MPRTSEPTLREPRLRRLRLLLWRWRPALLAALLGIAAWGVLGVLRPPDPATVAVLVPALDVPAGHVLLEGDLTTHALPADGAPALAARDPADVLGRRTSHPLAAGLPIDPRSLAPDAGWLVPGTDDVAVPVRLADPAVADLLPTAGPVTLVSATGTGAQELTAAAHLLARVESGPDGGLLTTPDGSGSLVVLAVPAEVATLVLDASAGGTLTVALPAPP